MAQQQQKRLRDIISGDVLSYIFEYDNTYKEKMNDVLFGLEIKYELWRRWKQNLFNCEKFKKDGMFRLKMEFILDYHFNNNYNEWVMGSMGDINFPSNIEIYCGGKLFYFSNQTENKRRAGQIYMERGFIKKDEIEVCFTFKEDINEKIEGQILTKEEYYYNTHYSDYDLFPEHHSYHHDDNFYLLEHFTKNIRTFY